MLTSVFGGFVPIIDENARLLAAAAAWKKGNRPLQST
jgi:hypothetical protein